MSPYRESGVALTPGVYLEQRPLTAQNCILGFLIFLSLVSERPKNPLGPEVNLRISAFLGLLR